ncbi:hypothetical protein Poly59_26280 [Rubripirellula reticaptiva]|uniref:Uncharacterized protein n=1 Tax=Rubripirellula reticaptiva TaxID=2528013 RepID=A0A5C6F766_9BACT|nr:hypothetical protein Poly59_26280 [Rubripirellula reticaptiva]
MLCDAEGRVTETAYCHRTTHLRLTIDSKRDFHIANFANRFRFKFDQSLTGIDLII